MAEHVMAAALGETTLAEFGASLHGELILPDDERYDRGESCERGHKGAGRDGSNRGHSQHEGARVVG
ncbi:MAG TPA: hypothetical protein VFQ25_13515 [Ktedonobacterales bacterium]|nr:hypothetical protein [Ktedonobacterales bacterium]